MLWLEARYGLVASIEIGGAKALNTAFPMSDIVCQVTFAPLCISVIHHDFMLNLFEDPLQ